MNIEHQQEFGRPIAPVEMLREEDGTYHLPRDVELIHIDLETPCLDDESGVAHWDLTISADELTADVRFWACDTHNGDPANPIGVRASWNEAERDITLLPITGEIKRVWFDGVR